MRILLAGDIHMSRVQVEYLYRIAKQNDIHLLIALGDVGYWPRTKQGRSFLATISYLAVSSNIEFWWLDGNHEDHYVLDMAFQSKDQRFLTTDYFYQSYGGIYYLPRGYRFELDGVKFMSYGGAFSIDRDARVENIDWFPQETIDPDHIKSISDEPVDVLLCHDAPTGYSLGYNENHPNTIASNANSMLLLDLIRKIRPKVCVAGHHHTRYDYQISTPNGWCDCHILHHNGMFDKSWAILDTEKLKEEWKANGLQHIV